MGTPLKDHVSPLLEPLIDELIAALCGFAWLAATGQEDTAFLVLDGHEIGWYLDVDDVGAIAMRAKVVHEQVVRVVDKEVESIDHLTVVPNQWHLYRLVDHLLNRRLRSLLLLQEFHRHLLL